MRKLHIDWAQFCCVAFLIAAGLPLAGLAESFDARLAKANELLHSGDYEGALSAYRDLQVEDPESDLLYYNMGCAQYEKAEGMAGAEFMDEAAQAYAEAAESFEKSVWSGSPALRRNAQYNLANTAAQLAKLSVGPGKEQEAQKAFEECIQKYEEFLARYPDDKAARNNLDHMRYYLKKMLQKPPPPEDEQQQEPQEGESEQQNEEQQQQGENGQREQEQQQQQQQQEQEQSQEQRDEQKEEQQQEQASAQQQEQEQSSQDQAQSSEEEPEPKDRQTIEAILQSLEDLDQREQYDLREGEIDSHLRKEWW